MPEAPPGYDLTVQEALSDRDSRRGAASFREPMLHESGRIRASCCVASYRILLWLCLSLRLGVRLVQRPPVLAEELRPPSEGPLVPADPASFSRVAALQALRSLAGRPLLEAPCREVAGLFRLGVAEEAPAEARR